MFHWLLYHFDKLTFFSVDSGQFGLFKLHLKICHLHIEKYFQRLVTNYLIVYGLLGLADKILSPAQFQLLIQTSLFLIIIKQYDLLPYLPSVVNCCSVEISPNSECLFWFIKIDVIKFAPTSGNYLFICLKLLVCNLRTSPAEI